MYFLSGVLLPDSLPSLQGTEVYSDGQSSSVQGLRLRHGDALTLVMMILAGLLLSLNVALFAAN